MRRFSYTRPEDIDAAVSALAANPEARAIAGGTNLVDLMKYNVEGPNEIIDINRLPLKSIEETEAGGLRIGALVTNADAAYDPRIEERYPLLASAMLAGASPQLRNAATVGGNLRSAPAVITFMTPAPPATSGSPVRVVRPSPG